MGSIGTSILSEVDAGPLERPPSIFDVFENTLRNHADDPAVIATHQPASYLAGLIGNNDRSGTPYLSWTYRELHNAAIQFVGGLAQRYNLGSGTRIVTFVPNGIEWTLVTWTLGIGKNFSSLQDPDMLNAPRAAELQNVLSRTMPDVVMVSDAEGAAAVDKALSCVTQVQPTVKIVLNDAQATPAGWTTLSSFASPVISDTVRAELERSAKDDDDSRVCNIMFTSGTTSGVPKGCPRTAASYLHIIMVHRMIQDGDIPPRTVVTTQNFRAIAMILAFMSYKAGGCLVMPGPAFSPAGVLGAIQKFRATSVIFVPAMVHALIAHPDFGKTETSSLQLVHMGGDMMTRNIYVKVASAFPSAAILNTHGMTEGGGALDWPNQNIRGNRESKLPWYANIGTLGKVYAGTKLRIADESNRPVKRGEIGEFHYNNISFIRNYVDNVKPEDFYTDEQGHWFKTGDTGIINEENYVFILGRNRDIVKRAGVKIQPAALESCLDSFLNSQTSVLAIPHPELGQEPFAVVRDLGQLTKDEVKEEIIKVFGDASALGGVATLKELGLVDFPINPTGKIMKRDLEQPIAVFLQVPETEVGIVQN